MLVLLHRCCAAADSARELLVKPVRMAGAAGGARVLSRVVGLLVRWRKSVALLTLAALVRWSQAFRRGVILLLLRSDAACLAAVRLSRLLLGSVFPAVLVPWWYPQGRHIALDECQVLHNLRYERRLRFGPHARELLDTLHPLAARRGDLPEPGPLDARGVAPLVADMALELLQHAPAWAPAPQFGHEGAPELSAPAVLFGHGGGWVCDGTDVQMQQVTSIARQGYSFFLYNYPLSPEERFPRALVSTLRALSWLKTERGHARVALVGESAGGNLVTMAAALVRNRHLLRELAREVEEPVADWPYPDISCVVAWYSILCSEHWRGAGWLSPGLDKVFEMYRGDALGGRMTLCDLEADLEAYPPTMLVAGLQDPLGLTESSRAAKAMLERKGMPVELHCYDDTHGFVGYPPSFQQAAAGGHDYWRDNARDAMRRTTAFLDRHHKKPAQTSRRRSASAETLQAPPPMDKDDLEDGITF